MKKSFGARRVPKQIAADEDDDHEAPPIQGQAATVVDTESTSHVRRPQTKPRKSLPSRSFAQTSTIDDDDDSSTYSSTKRNVLANAVLQRNATSITADQEDFDTDDRPSYSKSYLQELKASTPSTPSTPHILQASSDSHALASATTSTALDIASKFGHDLSQYARPTAIPSASEIAEKKARRARHAKEQDFVSLTDDNTDPARHALDEGSDEDVTHDDTGRLILRPKEKHPETRLVRDDEDLYEGFDDYTSDGRIAMSHDAQSKLDNTRRSEIAAQIATAQRVQDDDTDPDADDTADESEAERNAAFEHAQINHGTYTSHSQMATQSHDQRIQTPPRITPIPTLSGVLTRLKTKMQEMQIKREGLASEMRAAMSEKEDIEADERRVQASLVETAERFRVLREEVVMRNGREGQDQGQAVAIRPDESRDADASTGAGLGLGNLNTRRSRFDVGRPRSDDSDSSD